MRMVTPCGFAASKTGLKNEFRKSVTEGLSKAIGFREKKLLNHKGRSYGLPHPGFYPDKNKEFPGMFKMEDRHQILQRVGVHHDLVLRNQFRDYEADANRFRQFACRA